MEYGRIVERKTTEDHMISYGLQRRAIEDLVRYAYPTDHGTYISAREINLGSRTASSSLETVEGMVQLHKWFNAFSKSFALVAKFDSEVERNVPFNHADWRLMDESVTTALSLLRKKLESIAEKD